MPLLTPAHALPLTGVGQQVRHRPRVTPIAFAVPFGLAGLGQAWRAAGAELWVAPAVPGAIFVLAAAVWLILVARYAAQGPRQVLTQLHDAVLAPFVPLAVITPAMLGGALAVVAFSAGRVLVVISLVLTVAAGGWLTGQWIAGHLDEDSAHPGYFLPTVAGGLVGAAAAAEVHLHALAEASFGIGIVSWLVLGSTIWNRLFFRRALAPALVTTLAVELAPPAVAGSAYFALTGGSRNFIACALGGYTVLMAVTQVRFVPLYARLRFSPGFWAFVFSYAAVAADALQWIRFSKPPGAAGYAIAILALITVLGVAVAARTLIAMVRGPFFGAPDSGGDSQLPVTTGGRHDYQHTHTAGWYWGSGDCC
jgi:tellurite resistance protein